MLQNLNIKNTDLLFNKIYVIAGSVQKWPYWVWVWSSSTRRTKVKGWGDTKRHVWYSSTHFKMVGFDCSGLLLNFPDSWFMLCSSIKKKLQYFYTLYTNKIAQRQVKRPLNKGQVISDESHGTLNPHSLVFSWVLDLQSSSNFLYFFPSCFWMTTIKLSCSYYFQ